MSDAWNNLPKSPNVMPIGKRNLEIMEKIMSERKPIICLDFDGVIHSYTSGWQGADKVPDPPVDGSLEFIAEAINKFEVHIFSSRSNQEGGIAAMQLWLDKCFAESGIYTSDQEEELDQFIYEEIKWPTVKPPAMITIDDRAIQFDGTWPEINDLLAFQPWNKGAHVVKGDPNLHSMACLYYDGNEHCILLYKTTDLETTPDDISAYIPPDSDVMFYLAVTDNPLILDEYMEEVSVQRHDNWNS